MYIVVYVMYRSGSFTVIITVCTCTRYNWPDEGCLLSTLYQALTAVWLYAVAS
jgi:hypothetical protein